MKADRAGMILNGDGVEWKDPATGERPHRCRPDYSCRCSMLADAPSEDCPRHGGAVIDRCACGRFVRRQPVTDPVGETA